VARPDAAVGDDVGHDIGRHDSRLDVPVADVRVVDSSTLDSTASDTALPPDARPDAAVLDAATLDAGQARDLLIAVPKIVVTELLIDPDAASEKKGEWLELLNTTNQPIDLMGWTLRDTQIDKHKISRSLIVAPGARIVLGLSDDKSENGGVVVDYVYDNFRLGNKADEVELLDASGTLVDSFSYAGFWFAPGVSLSLKHPSLPRGNQSSWCRETSRWPGSDGDVGTPRAPPGC
jgi:hypothetical protein